MLPKKLKQQLDDRATNNSLRKLGANNNLIDFSSNDYLGLAKSNTIYTEAHKLTLNSELNINGASGSRLLTGNNNLYHTLENDLQSLFKTPALVYNSGYAANLGVFSTLPQRGDIILYDALIHTSIREGITLSRAKGYKFNHNDYQHLKALIGQFHSKFPDAQIYVVSESVFSMDGDQADLIQLANLCAPSHTHLIIDEAHAFGVFGDKGLGLVHDLGLSQNVCCTIITFGKAVGCHGSAVIAEQDIITYLINFSKSFIYTTALPPHNISCIIAAIKQLSDKNFGQIQRQNFHDKLAYFKSELKTHALTSRFIPSTSPIQCCVIGGNNKTKEVSQLLKTKGFDVKPILSPTVATGEERLRICIHSYNSNKEIRDLLTNLATFVA
ncbi:MAG: 8-amino-7-oxononanoate synthase [Bacteroidetes bacterium MedPE-SWsnd-G2]|nr:MAG: 8-amino-7-oxononanoate synthase [Bacteroidetes bacterium MedPE-SWsnd-G2]